MMAHEGKKERAKGDSGGWRHAQSGGKGSTVDGTKFPRFQKLGLHGEAWG